MIGNLRQVWDRPLYRLGVLQGIARRFLRWRRRRQGLEILRNMPDHLLKDIGISRLQVDHCQGSDPTERQWRATLCATGIR